MTGQTGRDRPLLPVDLGVATVDEEEGPCVSRICQRSDDDDRRLTRRRFRVSRREP